MTTLLFENQTTDQQFEILLCLRFINESSSEASSPVRSRAAALVKDVLLTKLNVVPEMLAPELVHVRGFDDMESTLVACRALQVAFEGFSDVSAQRAGISIVLDREPSFHADGNPSIAQRDLLRSARPFQVLVTQSFYDELRRRQPAALGSFRRQGGVYEFQWTRDQRLAELQGQDELMGTVVMPAPATVTTGINDQTMLMPVDEPLHEDPGPPSFGGLAERQVRGGKSRIWMVAGCAVVLLAIAGYLAMTYIVPRGQSKEQVTEAVARAAAQAPQSTPTEPVVPTPDPPPPPPPPHKSPRRTCDLNPGLVQGLLGVANDDLAKGAFPDAIRRYTKVLGCDPGNTAARDGLQRAKRAQAQ